MTPAGAADLRYPIGKFTPPAAFVPGEVGSARDALAALPAQLRDAVRGLDDGQLDTRYRDGGWTVRQVVHHVADSHLNSYGRFRLALTEDAPTIKPYAEARWAELPDARQMPVAVSIELLHGLHARWVALVDTFTVDDWQRSFVHPDHHRPTTLWSSVAMYAWHGKHHCAHITALRRRQGWNQ